MLAPSPTLAWNRYLQTFFALELFPFIYLLAYEQFIVIHLVFPALTFNLINMKFLFLFVCICMYAVAWFDTLAISTSTTPRISHWSMHNLFFSCETIERINHFRLVGTSTSTNDDKVLLSIVLYYHCNSFFSYVLNVDGLGTSLVLFLNGSLPRHLL